MAFFQRLLNYLVNEVLVQGLANSRAFQRFAVKTDAALTELKTKGACPPGACTCAVWKRVAQPPRASALGVGCRSWDVGLSLSGVQVGMNACMGCVGLSLSSLAGPLCYVSQLSPAG